MQKKKNNNYVMKPGIMLSQVWPDSRKKEGETKRALEIVLEYGFFKTFQTVEVPYVSERREIASLLKEVKAPLTYCLSRVLNENKLNLSDLNKENRKKSCAKVMECLEDAKEIGSQAVSLISGPAPSSELQRQDALKALEESLAAICEKADEDYGLVIIIEPLDYFAHKKNTLGTTKEAVAICENLKIKGAFPYLCLDTAHLFLNKEIPSEALDIANAYMREFHFCNCVTDKTHPIFGDNHIPFGKPGVLDEDGIVMIMGKLLEIGYFSKDTEGAVFCEVMKKPDGDSISLMEYNRKVLEGAWEKLSLNKFDNLDGDIRG